MRDAARSKLLRTGSCLSSSRTAIFRISASGRYFVGQVLRARSINLPTVASNSESGARERLAGEWACDGTLLGKVSWFRGFDAVLESSRFFGEEVEIAPGCF